MKEFSDPIAKTKGQEKTVKSPWDFSAFPYDQRSSCFINAGNDYGSGHKNPVGHMEKPKATVPTMPMSNKVVMAEYEG